MGGRRYGRAAIAAVPAALVAAGVAVAGIGGPTELVSLGSNPNPVTARGAQAAISGDGRYVAFSSDGRDLDATDANPLSDVFVKDRQSGDLTRITRAPDGGPANGESSLVRGGVSGDGGTVVFTSTAFNLGPHDVNKVSDVYAWDRSSGTIELISGADGGPLDADLPSYDGVVSADGRRVAFTSRSYDIAAGDLNGKPDVFVHDRTTGETKLASRTPAGLSGNGESGLAAISADGTKVAFASDASDLVLGDTNAKTDVFVYDVATERVERASVSSAEAQSNGSSLDPFISGDGRYVGFSSAGTNIGGVRRHGPKDYALYVRDAQGGTTERVMPDFHGTIPPDLPQNTGLGYEHSGGSVRAGSISADGRHVAFQTNSPSFVPGDGGGTDVFVLDRATDRFTVVTRTLSGGQPSGASTQPQLAADGSAVAFLSAATLTATPVGAPQVYVRPLTADPVAPDEDGDGVPNLDDNCPLHPNAGQEDLDADSRGDRCDFEDDSDGAVDALEPGNQGSDPLNPDSDGDGLGDWTDDYPADASQGIGTEHQQLNHPRFETDEDSGEPLTGAFALLDWKADSRRFEARLHGRGIAGKAYSLVVFRRGRFIREQTVCTAKADSAGTFGCTKTLPLSFFTHAALLRDGNEIDRDLLEHERAPLTGRGSD